MRRGSPPVIETRYKVVFLSTLGWGWTRDFKLYWGGDGGRNDIHNSGFVCSFVSLLFCDTISLVSSAFIPEYYLWPVEEQSTIH